MKGVGLKMSVLDCSQDFSHCRSVGVFSGARGRLALWSAVWSGWVSSSSRTLWLSSLPAGHGEDLVGDGGAGVFVVLFVGFSGMRGEMALVLVVVSGRDLGSSGLSCVSSLLSGEVDRIKNEGARVFAGFLPLWVFGFFPYARGRLPPRYLDGSGRVSDSSEMFWMSSLPAGVGVSGGGWGRWSVRSVIHRFFGRTEADGSWVGGGVWPKFELIRAFVCVLVACRSVGD